MSKMRWMGVFCVLALVAGACSDYAANNGYQPPLLNKDAAALVELRGSIDFGATLVGERFSVEKALTGYVFDANAGARVTVTLKSTNGEDPVLILYGPSDNKGTWGEHIAVDTVGDTNVDGAIEDLALNRSGRYLIALGTEDGSAGGTFDLALGCRGTCAEPRCADDQLACDLWCPNGFMTDPNGCPICRCVEDECQTDDDCPLFPWTDQIPRCVDGRCVFEDFYCDENTPCPEGFECIHGPCESCTEDGCPPCPGHCEPIEIDECGPDRPCPEGMLCVIECWGFDCEPGSDDCPPECDPETGECEVHCVGRCVAETVECETDDDCPPGQVCEISCWECDDTNPDGDCLPGCEGHCVPETLPECDSDDDCPEGMTCVMECWQAGCDPETGECPPDCDPAAGECGPICVGHCVPIEESQCEVDEDCLTADGQMGHCFAGRCIYEEIPCGPDGALCPPGMECVTVCWDCPDGDPDCVPGCESLCVPVEPECRVDTDCISAAGELGRCIDGHCVYEPMYCHVDWECPPGFVCEMIECDPGCGDASDPDCCVGICVPDQEPECFEDTDCITPDGQMGQCIDGRCVFDPCVCPDIWDPVCAVKCYNDADECPPGDPCEGECVERTYANACFAECDGAAIIHVGECGTEPLQCVEDADCPAGMYCEHCIGPDGSAGPCHEIGVCLPLEPLQCLEDADCPEGFRCDVECIPGCQGGPDDNGCCQGHCVPVEAQCIETGCNGEICAPFPMSSTCVWLPEYECLQFASCEMLVNDNGQAGCGWFYSPEYYECLENINNSGQCTDDTDCPPGTICQVFCDESGECESRCLVPDCVCPEYYEPVCGADGVTYDNRCFASCAGVQILYPGPCE